MAFISIDEMKSVMYKYQMDEITESDDSVVLMAIDSAVSEIRGYLTPSNQRQWSDGRPMYDVGKIFEASGTERDALILELCKDIACYRVCRLSNVDMMYDHVKERYQAAVDWLTKVAAGTVNPNLPKMDFEGNDDGDGSGAQKLFRHGSRYKFRHE